MLIFRQLFDPASSTYTYLLGDAGQAVLVDTVFEHERRDVALLRELGLALVATLDTHVHADHVTGAWLLKQRCGSQIMLSADASASHADRALVALGSGMGAAGIFVAAMLVGMVVHDKFIERS